MSRSNCLNLRISFLFAVALILKANTGTAEDAGAKPRNVATHNFNLAANALEGGASVYLCSIVQRDPYLIERNEEIGKITLKVDKVLHGSNRKEIILPYAYVPINGFGGLDQLVWPTIETNGVILLCTVLPNARDPATRAIPGVTEAATSVKVVTGENDPKVLEMEKICEVYSFKATSRFESELKNAATDPRLSVRLFGLEDMVLHFGKSQPDEVISLLQSKASAYKGRQEIDEASQLIYYLRFDFNIKSAFRIRCLAAIARSTNPSVREQSLDAVTGTARMIVSFSTSPTNIFSNASEKSKFEKILRNEMKDQNGKEFTNSVRIQHWLSSGQWTENSDPK